MENQNFSILVVDDEKNITDLLKDILEDEGFNVDVAFDISSAKEKIKEKDFDIVFLDVWLPDGEGTDLIPFIRENNEITKIIMISGHANIPIAVKALKEGAYDFLEKPISTESIFAVIEKATKEIKKDLEYIFLKQQQTKDIEIIGNSPPMQELKKQIERVAKTNAWIMIFGENGTGKELVAKSIHFLSDRANKPFVDINCAALPDDLIEAELFGYEKGAFTGAVSRKPGKLEIADGGTLFLDEVTDMSLSAQAKLLRVLEEKEFTRLGSNQKIRVDIRVISATNKDLDKEIEEGRFRQDLAFRLAVIPIHVPPLRERGQDIILLAEYFLKKSCIENKIEPLRLSDDVKKALLRYDWPGNVRELKNLMERLCIFASGEEITVEDLPPYIFKGKSPSGRKKIEIKPLKKVREEAEKEVIQLALEKYGRNLKEVAKVLDIDLSSLYRKLKQYNLEE
ncbi:DNA-binding transcriptional response regulator, NtrC family, contains REC, AAA-type ATPase, and a Fis-type DNA-binding domains [Persephonella hydrogeniphila]|uniref:DNA-binding transcriptional response regulator, NtrC family, contains REC, AAA-type ATPase, and a Fis-type DNA-binding domains n=1 Tax=Persephonella hydrogeniphila TaxID=198703 RepID=A0A285NM51_9AQUI|nr:sigma-54 dependent transcriptional regulator [Persephonella hydrogeniphila]SNZ10549.1 DNA-binding transcriptional response regulator, NtrC family, contains REC, AAA-type ATPase, and a Fis-type DNA-binding domains [Persephonella hydrogeniphila]